MLYAWDKVCQLMVVLCPEELDIYNKDFELKMANSDKQRNYVALMQMSNNVVRLMKYD